VSAPFEPSERPLARELREDADAAKRQVTELRGRERELQILRWLNGEDPRFGGTGEPT